MTKTDDAVLEWLEDKNLPAPPKQIHLTMENPPSYTTINRRLRKLKDMGLVEKHPDAEGYYRLTELGDRYLNDPTVSVDEFLEDEEDDDPEEEQDEE